MSPDLADLEDRLRHHYASLGEPWADEPPPLRLPDVPAAGRRRRPARLVATAAAVALVVAGAVAVLVRDRGDGPAERVQAGTSVPAHETTSVPATTAAPSTTVSGEVAAGEELQRLVASLVPDRGLAVRWSSASREPVGDRSYDEVRVADERSTLVVAVGRRFADTPANLARWNTELEAFPDATAWLGVDSEAVRAVHVVRGGLVGYARVQGVDADRDVAYLRTLAYEVLRAWVPPTVVPGSRPDLGEEVDLSGDTSLRVRAEIVETNGGRTLRWVPEVEAPPGTEIWALYVDGRLQSRTGPADLTGTHGSAIGPLDADGIEVVLRAQTWDGTTLASSPSVTFTR